MQEFGREDRVGATMRRELAELVRVQLRDPRIGMVTIQEVRASRDLAHARVFFTILDPTQIKKTEQLLNKAAPYLRRRLAERLPLRTVPELRFVYDKSVAEGMRLSALIDQAVDQDRQAHEKD